MLMFLLFECFVVFVGKFGIFKYFYVVVYDGEGVFVVLCIVWIFKVDYFMKCLNIWWV